MKRRVVDNLQGHFHSKFRFRVVYHFSFLSGNFARAKKVIEQMESNIVHPESLLRNLNSNNNDSALHTRTYINFCTVSTSCGYRQMR